MSREAKKILVDGIISGNGCTIVDSVVVEQRGPMTWLIHLWQDPSGSQFFTRELQVDGQSHDSHLSLRLCPNQDLAGNQFANAKAQIEEKRKNQYLKEILGS